MNEALQFLSGAAVGAVVTAGLLYSRVLAMLQSALTHELQARAMVRGVATAKRRRN